MDMVKFMTLNYSNWLATMKEELKAIEKNRTWELMDKSVNKRYIWCKTKNPCK